MLDDGGNPLINKKYIAFLDSGKTAEGITDFNGFTNEIRTIQKEDVSIHVFLDKELDVEQ
ncbi:MULTISPECIES: hypothetical protein [Acinetobacter]|uniref:Uncharacterized protein n=1 Tax=Acinetobacter higginsii TaxID=70347 RepID=N9RKB4_9GAMM|nr:MULTISPECIES: hypothetical protein [Acinetobacter]ENX58414.1 hypothetical protein F902_02814 [Acinetobacter higginsii]